MTVKKLYIEEMNRISFDRIGNLNILFLVWPCAQLESVESTSVGINVTWKCVMSYTITILILFDYIQHVHKLK